MIKSRYIQPDIYINRNIQTEMYKQRYAKKEPD